MTQEADYYFFRGRVAEHAIIKALGIGSGDEVAIQAFTCVAVAAPVMMTGARPIYIDIDAGSYNLNPQHLAASITSRTKAVIVQHTFGIPGDMDAVKEIAQRRRLAVIEDCCPTLASAYKGKRVGTFGDAAFSSHRWGKPIVLGAGGRAVVRGEELCAEFLKVCASSQPTSIAKTVRILLEYFAHENLLRPSLFWVMRDIFRSLCRNGLAMATFDEKEMRGLMSDAGKRIPELHRRWLNRRLLDLDQDTQFRRSVANRYGEVLKVLGAQTYDLDERFDPVFLRYPFLVENKPLVLERAREKGVELGDWFVSAVHPLSSAADLARIGYEMGSCPTAEAVSNRVVTLPIDHRIGPRCVEKTIQFLTDLGRDGLLAAPRVMQVGYA
jgi:perosamine synthetase